MLSPICFVVLGTLQDMIVDKFHISGKDPFSSFYDFIVLSTNTNRFKRCFMNIPTLDDSCCRRCRMTMVKRKDLRAECDEDRYLTFKRMSSRQRRIFRSFACARSIKSCCERKNSPRECRMCAKLFRKKLNMKYKQQINMHEEA